MKTILRRPNAKPCSAAAVVEVFLKFPWTMGPTALRCSSMATGSHPDAMNNSSLISKLRRWVAEGLAHSFGEPEQEHRLEPPRIGVQPFHDDPRRSRA